MSSTYNGKVNLHSSLTFIYILNTKIIYTKIPYNLKKKKSNFYFVSLANFQASNFQASNCNSSACFLIW